MSWQIGSFVVVTLALGAGLIWYERSRPPAQIVALVAVLAALAVAGRILLAPLPNVVATTDIVLFAGYVLGPAPGFAVGALGGLVSNFWLGQGAWTPWQMVGWGMTGIAGAVLWRLSRGNANRVTLAVACGLAGLVFGAWMNLQTTVSYGGEISLDRYLALEVRSIPFDLAHMTGNFAFAFVVGPAMISALRRFRERFEWRRASGVGGLGLITLVIGVAMLASAVAPPTADASYPKEVRKAASWLKTQQNGDGGFPSSPGGSSAVTFTARSMLGLAAANINPLDVQTGGKTPYDYLVANRKDLSKANEIALAILALKTVDKNPRKFEGRNLVEALRKRQGNGSFGNDVNVAAWAALAFDSAGATGSAQKSVEWLYSAQNMDTNGGFGIAKGARSDPDSTGTALMAIGGKKRIRHAMSYLRGAQKSSGGFANGPNVNSQSTGLVIQGMVAAGKGPRFLKTNGKTAADYLLARQQSDGSIWYSRDSDQTRVWVTADAIAALAAKPLPIAAPPREEKEKPSGNGGGSGGGSGSGSGGGSTSTYNPGPGSLASPSPGSSSPSTGNGSGSGSSRSVTPAIPYDSVEPDDDPVLPEVVPVTPVVPSDAVLAASQAGPSPSPLIAILICLTVTGGLCGGTIWLVRRFKW